MYRESLLYSPLESCAVSVGLCHCYYYSPRLADTYLATKSCVCVCFFLFIFFIFTTALISYSPGPAVCE